MFPSVDLTGLPERLAVSAAVVLRAGSHGRKWVLLSRRLPGSHLAGFWEFPGGKIRPGEGGADCARRETEEETGVWARPTELLLRVEHRYPQRDVELEFHLCAFESGTPRPDGCAAVRWVRPANLGCYRFPEANAEVVERLQERLGAIRG